MRVSALVRIPVAPTRLARFARAVVRSERARLDALSITFVSPARMRSLNRRLLGRDRVTDVIALSLGRRANGTPPGSRHPAAGDIYICPMVAAREARQAGTTLKGELARLVAHGVLHVLGWDHPHAAARRLRSPMWRRQERYVARFGSLSR